MVKLKPCPFCGGEAIAFNKGGWKVMCTKCTCQTGAFSFRKYAEDAWNTRVENSVRPTVPVHTALPKVDPPKVEKPEDDFYYGADDRERMQMCLTCEKPKCNNCLEGIPHPDGRKKKRGTGGWR